MVETILGARIRERRRQLGVTQAEMARRIGISASYLNLIEGNRRRITGNLLHRTAAELGVSVDDLGGARERRLAEDLAEIAATPGLTRLGAETEQTGEFVGRFPGWARTVAALAGSERAAEARVRALAERLSHDPFLGETVHRMLTRTAAVRSAAEILEDYSDMSDEERKRFSGIVLSEAKVLSEVGETLAHYFDGLDASDRMLTPIDEVDRLFVAHQNHFEELEAAASSIDARLTETTVSERGAAATELVRTALEDVIADFVNQHPQIQTAAGRARATRTLQQYAARAVMMPMGQFARVARTMEYDAEMLAEHFRVPLPSVLRRLPAIPREAGFAGFGYVRVNASGSLLEAQIVDGLIVPRHAPPCPLWILFSAQRSPERMVRQRAVFTNGEAFVFVAKAHVVGRASFDMPQHYVTDMLVVPTAIAGLTVYGPGSELTSEDVGPACRICARSQCPHRVEDPFLG
ncbi:MAG: short-chain fatty acyl-CoA regulator family protein [Pseudomonadota bacterium]